MSGRQRTLVAIYIAVAAVAGQLALFAIAFEKVFGGRRWAIVGMVGEFNPCGDHCSNSCLGPTRPANLTLALAGGW